MICPIRLFKMAHTLAISSELLSSGCTDMYAATSWIACSGPYLTTFSTSPNAAAEATPNRMPSKGSHTPNFSRHGDLRFRPSHSARKTGTDFQSSSNSPIDTAFCSKYAIHPPGAKFPFGSAHHTVPPTPNPTAASHHHGLRCPHI